MLGVLGVRVVKGARFVAVSCLCHVALQVTEFVFLLFPHTAV